MTWAALCLPFRKILMLKTMALDRGELVVCTANLSPARSSRDITNLAWFATVQTSVTVKTILALTTKKTLFER